MERKANPNPVKIGIGCDPDDEFVRSGGGQLIIMDDNGTIHVSHDSYWIESFNFGVSATVHHKTAEHGNIAKLLRDGSTALWGYIESEVLKHMKAEDVRRHIAWEKEASYSAGKESVRADIRLALGIDQPKERVEEKEEGPTLPRVCENCKFYVPDSTTTGRCSHPDSLEDSVGSTYTCEQFTHKKR